MQNEDIRNLKILAIFHYVVGGIIALFSCMFIMHIVMGIAVLTGNFFGEAGSGDAPPEFMGWMFIIIGSVAVLSGWLTCLAMVIAGRKLKQQKNRLYCMIIAGIECMFMPFGTVLGVFTLINLTKDSVKALFDNGSEQLPT